MPLGLRRPTAKTSILAPSFETLQHRPTVLGGVAALGVVETALRIGFEAGAVFVPAGRDLAVVVEVFVEVGFAVAVQVVQAGDLVAAQDVDHPVDDPQAQRLIQAGGEALPCEVIELVVDAADDPNVAADGSRWRRPPSGKKVDAREAEVALPGVVVGSGERIDDIGPLVSPS